MGSLRAHRCRRLDGDDVPIERLIGPGAGTDVDDRPRVAEGGVDHRRDPRIRLTTVGVARPMRLVVEVARRCLPRIAHDVDPSTAATAALVGRPTRDRPDPAPRRPSRTRGRRRRTPPTGARDAARRAHQHRGRHRRPRPARRGPQRGLSVSDDRPTEEALPDGWDTIPGARGCTPEACAFRDHHADLLAAGADAVYGLSSQRTEEQVEAVTRLHLPFPLVSDPDLQLADVLQLPTFDAGGTTRYRRLTLIITAGTIEHAFYPIFPPDGHAGEVLRWLRAAGTST